jgi:hypothetical protein
MELSMWLIKRTFNHLMSGHDFESKEDIAKRNLTIHSDVTQIKGDLHRLAIQPPPYILLFPLIVEEHNIYTYKKMQIFTSNDKRTYYKEAISLRLNLSKKKYRIKS